MNTSRTRLVLFCSLGAFSLLSSQSRAAIVDSGESSARDIFVNATVTATALGGLNLANVNVTVPSLNSVAGSTAVDGANYNLTPPVLDPSVTVSSGVLNLTAGAAV